MEGKENKLMTKERICLWYKDWSGTVKFIHSSYLLLLLYTIPIYIVYRIQWEISEPLAGRIIKPETTIPVPIFGIPIFRIR